MNPQYILLGLRIINAALAMGDEWRSVAQEAGEILERWARDNRPEPTADEIRDLSTLADATDATLAAAISDAQ